MDLHTNRLSADTEGMQDFASLFGELFALTPPLAYCLRADHHERWLRIHSLPQPKRYTDTEGEREEVRRRALAAASEVLPAGFPVWLVSCRFGDEPDHVQPADVPSLAFHRVGRYEHALFDALGFDGPCIAHAAQSAWPRDDFEQVLDTLAQDALWFSPASGEVFAPYDGGVDLFVATPARVTALRNVFPHDWFSRRPDGL